jgi:predicted nucleotidyltransferase
MIDQATQTRSSPRADEVIATLRAHEAELRAAGIRRLSLFGSVARGEAGPDSDIDLAVELDRDAKIGLFELAGLVQRISELLKWKAELLPGPVEKIRLRANIERDRKRAF